jgi:hypothetical protein
MLADDNELGMVSTRLMRSTKACCSRRAVALVTDQGKGKPLDAARTATPRPKRWNQYSYIFLYILALF